MYVQRQLEPALLSRSLGGYFTDVISVHPLAGLFDTEHDRFGLPVIHHVADGHLFVEGRLRQTKWLRVMPPLNFLLAQFSLMRLLVRLAQETNIEVVRVGDPYYLGIMGIVLARLLNVPLAIRVPFRYDELRRVTGRATMPRLFRFGWVEKRLERLVFPRCELIAGANEDNMRYAVENGGRPEVATVFPYGNLLHPMHWTEPHQRPDADGDLERLGLNHKRFIITISRLERMKRVDQVLEVTAELARLGVDIASVIVGDGSLKEELTQRARALGICDHVVFAGNQTQEWIARVLPRASVIVSPHMGRALAEAALSGLPIVAFDYDWQREIVVNGETGYLVPNGDWRTMALKVEQLLADSELAKELGRQARMRVLRMMAPEVLQAHERRVYAALRDRWSARRSRKVLRTTAQ
jgi:glycosyltransferase involved in cell wall biosynthesis